MSKRPVGRPKKYKKSEVAEIMKNFQNYIDDSDLPILSEFSYQNKIPRQTFYD